MSQKRKKYYINSIVIGPKTHFDSAKKHFWKVSAINYLEGDLIFYNIVHQQCCMNIVTMFEYHLNRVVAEFKVCKIRIQIMLEHLLLTHTNVSMKLKKESPKLLHQLCTDVLL